MQKAGIVCAAEFRRLNESFVMEDRRLAEIIVWCFVSFGQFTASSRCTLTDGGGMTVTVFELFALKDQLLTHS